MLRASNWSDAESKAQQMGGHLATIRSSSENTWVTNTFGAKLGLTNCLWIGLNDSGLEGSWKWSSGEEISYLNWFDGEPNNFGDSEDFGFIWHVGHQVAGRWNDWRNDLQGVSNGSFTVHGIVELVPNILVNGSFEFEEVERQQSALPGSNLIRGWDVVGPNSRVDLWRGNTEFGGPDPADGQQVAIFNSGSMPIGSQLQQSFITKAGALFRVGLSFGKRGTGNGYAGIRVEINDSLNGTPLLGYAEHHFLTVGAWSKSSFLFLAQSSRSTIRVTDYSMGDMSTSDLILDDVWIREMVGSLKPINRETFLLKTEPNYSYILETTPEIGSLWKPLGARFLGDGQNVTISIPIESDVFARFFRVGITSALVSSNVYFYAKYP